MVQRLVPPRNSSTHRYVAKLRCRHTADSRTARVAILANFESVWVQIFWFGEFLALQICTYLLICSYVRSLFFKLANALKIRDIK